MATATAMVRSASLHAPYRLPQKSPGSKATRMKVAVLTHAEGAHMSAYLSALAEAKDCDEGTIKCRMDIHVRRMAMKHCLSEG